MATEVSSAGQKSFMSLVFSFLILGTVTIIEHLKWRGTAACVWACVCRLWPAGYPTTCYGCCCQGNSFPVLGNRHILVPWWISAGHSRTVFTAFCLQIWLRMSLLNCGFWFGNVQRNLKRWSTHEGAAGNRSLQSLCTHKWYLQLNYVHVHIIQTGL